MKQRHEEMQHMCAALLLLLLLVIILLLITISIIINYSITKCLKLKVNVPVINLIREE